ncbi:MAG: cell division protein FtsA, partial [Candidatus Nealsonbacteria bacterium]
MPKSITLTALDIGTSSIKGVCARKNLVSGEIEILAKSQMPCFGVRNGEVIKPQDVSKTISEVKEDLIQKSGIKIKEVLVNISGPHLFSVSSQGVVSVSRADQKISREDIQRVLKQAEAVNLPSNKEVLEVFPKEFIIDGEGGIKDPLGLEGMRLEAKVLLCCLFSPILENLEKAVVEGGFQILEVIPSPLASSRACLTPQQKELGVLLVDIGAGTCSISVFEKGDLIDFAVFPAGSANITNDIAICLRTEISTAERIKKEFATLK